MAPISTVEGRLRLMNFALSHLDRSRSCSPLDSNRFQSDVLLGSNLIRCHVVDQSDSAEKVHEQATKFQLLETHLAWYPAVSEMLIQAKSLINCHSRNFIPRCAQVSRPPRKFCSLLESCSSGFSMKRIIIHNMSPCLGWTKGRSNSASKSQQTKANISTLIGLLSAYLKPISAHSNGRLMSIVLWL